MKILLIGEYSNVHAMLAEGLRRLGHEVTVASNGDFWKNYPRDIDLARKPGKWSGILLLLRLAVLLPRLRGYDIVQLINPMFVELKACWNRRLYRYLRRNNRHVVMGAFGMDYYWVSQCLTAKPLRYSDFNIGDHLRTDADAMKERKDWLGDDGDGRWMGTEKGRLNQLIAKDCDAIVAGLYEYWACYVPLFREKTTFIPFPLKPEPGRETTAGTCTKAPLRIFIGINKTRNVYKGTDIMLRALEDVVDRYPDKVTIVKAVSVPFAEYVRLMDGCDLIMDQLYSYTPAMNALQAMAKGLVCVGGGEEENYEILGENELRPIINVQPNYRSVYDALVKIVLHPENVERMKKQSMEYISRHHDYIHVAERYAALYAHLDDDRNDEPSGTNSDRP